MAASVTFAEDTLTNNATFDRTPGTVAEDIGTATESTDVATAAYVTDIFSKYTRGIPALQLRAQAIAAQALMTDFTASTRSYAEAALFLLAKRNTSPVEPEGVPRDLFGG